MVEYKPIKSHLLLLDLENPRVEDQSDQQGAVEALLEEQKSRIIGLASDVVEFGFDPSALPIVVPSDDIADHYVVVEGNRRVTIAHLLLDPSLLPDETPSKIANKIRALAKKVDRDVVESILCCVMPSREDADHWIELRHTGMNKGAGLVPWTGAQTARNSARRGKKKPAHQLLQIVREHGTLSDEARDVIAKGKFHITNLGRLVSDPYVREALGFTKERDVVSLGPDPAATLRAISYVVERIATGAIAVAEIYNVALRQKFIANLPPGLLPRDQSGSVGPEDDIGAEDPNVGANAGGGEPGSGGYPGAGEGDAGVGEENAGVGEENAGVGEENAGVGEENAGVGEENAGVGEENAGVGDGGVTDGGATGEGGGGKTSKVDEAPDGEGIDSDSEAEEKSYNPSMRRELVPKTFKVRCTGRLRDLIEEGRTLILLKHTNSCAVLIRLILEMAANHYQLWANLPDLARIAANLKSEPASLSQKLQAIAHDMSQRGSMTKDELTPVRSALQKGAFLEASVTRLNDYVHNLHHRPDPTTVRVAWDNLAPFIRRMCEDPRSVRVP